MTPVPFREQNHTFLPPPGMEDKVGSLTLWERIKLLFTGRMWFSVIGNAQPPIWLGVHCPFIRRR